MTASDLEAVLRIERESFDAPWDRDQFLAPVGGDGLPLDLILAIESPGNRGRIAGYASAWIVAGEMQINNIAMAKECRRQGLGTRMLRHLLDEAVRQGCAEVSLEVSRANQGAIRMYEACGFRKVGIRKAYYRNSGEDALILTHLLGIVL